MGKTAYLCEQLVKFVAAGKMWKKLLLVGWLIFFLFKEEKLLHSTSTVALPRQECGPSSHSLPVLAEPPLLLSLSFFNTTVCSQNWF